MAPNPDSRDGASKYDEQTPISPWVFEIVVKHGDGTDPEDRFDQIAELVDRLAESTAVPEIEAYDVAGETRRTHKSMVETAEMRGVITSEHVTALENAFERLVTAWIQSPTEIHAELDEYRKELAAVREAATDG